VLTGQYTNEEYKDLLVYFVTSLKLKNIFHWINNPEKVNEFDGLLLRGDRNPNTKGLEAALKLAGHKGKWEDLQAGLNGKKIKAVVVAGPEDQSVYPDLAEKHALFAQADNLIWMTACPSAVLDQSGCETWQIPVKTHVEKAGTFTNFQGKEQKFPLATTIVPQALTLSEVAEIFSGKDLNWNLRPKSLGGAKNNYATTQRGVL
jgi:NADH-quinone oxidoreductase subunit G